MVSGVTGPTGSIGKTGGPIGVSGMTGPQGPTQSWEAIGSIEVPAFLGFRVVYLKSGNSYDLSLVFMSGQHYFICSYLDNEFVFKEKGLSTAMTEEQMLCFHTCLAYCDLIAMGLGTNGKRSGNNNPFHVTASIYPKVKDDPIWAEILVEARKAFQVAQVMMT